MKIAHIEVTLDDIAHGAKMDCKNCPISRALQRLYPEAFLVAVSSHIQVLFKDEETQEVRSYHGPAPQEAINFMNRFDGGHAVSPFSFEVTLHRI